MNMLGIQRWRSSCKYSSTAGIGLWLAMSLQFVERLHGFRLFGGCCSCTVSSQGSILVAEVFASQGICNYTSFRTCICPASELHHRDSIPKENLLIPGAAACRVLWQNQQAGALTRKPGMRIPANESKCSKSSKMSHPGMSFNLGTREIIAEIVRSATITCIPLTPRAWRLLTPLQVDRTTLSTRA